MNSEDSPIKLTHLDSKVRKRVKIQLFIPCILSRNKICKGDCQALLHTTQARIALKFILDHKGNAYLPSRMVEHLIDEHLYQVPLAPVFNRPIFACFHQEIRITNTIDDEINIISNVGEIESNQLS